MTDADNRRRLRIPGSSSGAHVLGTVQLPVVTLGRNVDEHVTGSRRPPWQLDGSENMGA